MATRTVKVYFTAEQTDPRPETMFRIGPDEPENNRLTVTLGAAHSNSIQKLSGVLSNVSGAAGERTPDNADDVQYYGYTASSLDGENNLSFVAVKGGDNMGVTQKCYVYNEDDGTVYGTSSDKFPATADYSGYLLYTDVQYLPSWLTDNPWLATGMVCEVTVLATIPGAGTTEFMMPHIVKSLEKKTSGDPVPVITYDLEVYQMDIKASVTGTTYEAQDDVRLYFYSHMMGSFFSQLAVGGEVRIVNAGSSSIDVDVLSIESDETP